MALTLSILSRALSTLGDCLASLRAAAVRGGTSRALTFPTCSMQEAPLGGRARPKRLGGQVGAVATGRMVTTDG